MAATDNPVFARRRARVRVGSHEYAIGLFWVMAESAAKVDKQARNTAIKLKEDLYAVRSGNVAQYGISKKGGSHRAGLRCAAPIAADKIRGNWVGVFASKEGYWLVAVRDDAILSEGDVFFSTLEQAQSQLLKLIESHHWDKVFAPEGFGIEGSQELVLADLLGSSGQAPKLKYINGSKALIRYGVAASVLAGAAMYAWGEYQAREEERIMNELRFKAAAVKPKLPQAAPPVAAPWETEAHPSVVVAACEQAMGRIAITVPGWTLTEVSCNGTDARAAWKRSFGSIPMADATLEAAGLPASRVEGNGDVLSVNTAVSKRGDVPAKAAELPLSDAVKATYGIFAKPGYSVNIVSDPAASPAALPQGYSATTAAPGQMQPQARNFRSASFKVATPFEPSLWRDFLGMPGVVVKGVAWDPQTRNWNISGVIYDRAS